MSRPRTLRRGAVASLVAAVVVLAIGLPLAAPLAHAAEAGQELGQPSISPAPSDPHVNVTINTTDVPAFVPNSIHVTSGENLTIKLVNTGTYAHTFTLSPNGTEVFPLNWTPTELQAYFSAHKPLLNVSMPANSTSFANLSINSSMAGGHFEFVSTVPYQFQAGLYGFLNVSVPVSERLTFYVNASDTYRFLPGALNASSVTKFPVAITVFFGTVGVLAHTFTVSPLPNYNLSSSNYTTFLTQHPPLVSIPVPSSAGTYNNGTFEVSAPGYYEYICTITGHFASGMDGFLYVGVAFPHITVTVVSTAIVDWEVLLGGGALIALGVVLAAAAAITGRFPPPKPPAEHY